MIFLFIVFHSIFCFLFVWFLSLFHFELFWLAWKKTTTAIYLVPYINISFSSLFFFWFTSFVAQPPSPPICFLHVYRSTTTSCYLAPRLVDLFIDCACPIVRIHFYIHLISWHRIIHTSSIVVVNSPSVLSLKKHIRKSHLLSCLPR